MVSDLPRNEAKSHFLFSVVTIPSVGSDRGRQALAACPGVFVHGTGSAGARELSP